MMRITVKMMTHNIFNVQPFFTTFFKENHCSVKEDHALLHVKLSKEMDKALMNRPFYWHYVEATNQIGVPQTVSFSFDGQIKDDKIISVHFGCPWFQKVKRYLHDNCTMIYAYEAINRETKTMLQPWLLTNMLITYSGKNQKEELHSFGLNLINGTMHLNMMEKLNERSITTTIPDFCYTISPVITLQSGFKRIEQFVYKILTEKEHRWAIEANEALHEEIEMLQHFYRTDENDAQFQKEINAAKKRLLPTITMTVLSGGLLYLTENFITTETKKSSTLS